MKKINAKEFKSLILGGITSEELEQYDYSQITNMSFMFAECKELKSVPLFNTVNVTNMCSMFYGCESLESVPLFNTKNVTEMIFMFDNCYNLKYIEPSIFHLYAFSGTNNNYLKNKYPEYFI